MVGPSQKQELPAEAHSYDTAGSQTGNNGGGTGGVPEGGAMPEDDLAAQLERKLDR